MHTENIPRARFPYRTAEFENVPCNLCGRATPEILNHRDRNGLKVESCICKYCGLIYLSPRMTAKWYGEYYNTEYRAQMARFRGKPAVPPDYDEMFRVSTRHGVALAKFFKSEWEEGLTVEVGSSVGGVLNGIHQELGSDVFGIEPSPDESQYANQHGIKTCAALIESFQEYIPPAANIVCTQSLNHFLDPRYFLTWANDRLRPGGLLMIEVMNFRHVFRRFGWMPRAIQIDHTYMFVPEVLANFVEAGGFDLIRLDSDEFKSEAEIKSQKKSGLPSMHIRIIARKTDRQPFSDPARIKEQSSAIRKSLNDVPSKPVRYFFKYRFKKLLKGRFSG